MYFWAAAVLFCLAIQFAHYPFGDTEMAWHVGWTAQDITSVILTAGWLWFVPRRYVFLKTALIVFLFWNILTTWMNLHDWYGYNQWAFGGLLAVIFFTWMAKQFFPIIPKPDPYTADRYMIGIRRPSGRFGILNFLRPDNCVFTGGRVVTGGGNIWAIRDGKFVREPITEKDLHRYVMLDTGRPVNDLTNAELDETTGQEYHPLFNNCSRLDVGVSLNWLAFRRLLKK